MHVAHSEIWSLLILIVGSLTLAWALAQARD